MPLPPEYYSTVFLLEDAPTPLPSSFSIVTAWNPMDELTPLEANEKRDGELRGMLELRGISYFRATGCSPDLSHREPGWAMVVEDEVALGFAREFRQRGLWRVVGDRLWLVDCEDGSAEEVGGFSDRMRS